MLRTSAKPEQVIKGVDQQDFAEIQVLANCFPYRQGAQKRVPGKILEQKLSSPIFGIHTFYMVYGRRFNITDYGTDLEIIEELIPPIVLPALPPSTTSWFDSFSSYSPVGLISRLWGAGNWLTYVGICESLIYGVIDPFLVSDSVAAIPVEDVPRTVPQDGTTTTTQDTGINFYFPNGAAQIMLQRVIYDADYSCIGGGTVPVAVDDILNVYQYSGDPAPYVVGVLDIPILQSIAVESIRVGRSPNVAFGVANTTLCPNPPSIFPNPPVGKVYYLIISSGEYGQES